MIFSALLQLVTIIFLIMTSLFLVCVGIMFLGVATGWFALQYNTLIIKTPGQAETPEVLLSAIGGVFILVGISLAASAIGMSTVAATFFMSVALLLFGLVMYAGYIQVDQRRVVIAKRAKFGGRRVWLGFLGMTLILFGIISFRMPAIAISPPQPPPNGFDFRMPPIIRNIMTNYQIIMSSFIGITTALYALKRQPPRLITATSYLIWTLWTIITIFQP